MRTGNNITQMIHVVEASAEIRDEQEISLSFHSNTETSAFHQSNLHPLDFSHQTLILIC